MNDIEAKTKSLLKESSSVAEDLGGDTFLNLIHCLSITFAILTIGMICFLLINRIVQNKAKVKEEKLRSRYQDYLANFISIPIQDELSSMGVSTFRTGLKLEDLKCKRNREILLQELFLLHRELTGYQAEMLKHLFWGWSMQEDVINELSSKSHNRVKWSLDMIMEFQLKDQLIAVYDLVNSKHIDVRAAAMSCCILLSDGQFDFLEKIDIELTDWEKHKVLSVVQGLPEKHKIDFSIAAKRFPQHVEFINELKSIINPEFAQYKEWVEEIHQL